VTFALIALALLTLTYLALLMRANRASVSAEVRAYEDTEQARALAALMREREARRTTTTTSSTLEN
jgi:hypothetical protein